MMEQGVMTFADFRAVLRRRAWSFILPTGLIVLVAIITALVLPPVYQSKSTILIEEQEIPAEYVMTTVTSYAVQRLQMINQRIMSTSRLLEIIDRFNLYTDMRGKYTTEEIIEEMRDAIKMETINVDVMDRRTGRPGTATIAFTLSYEGKDNPAVIQQVATVLASFFLEENLKVRERHAVETSQFFAAELEKMKEELETLDAKLAAYKGQHVDALPEMLQVNLQSLNSVEHVIERLYDQLRALKEKEASLQTQLANVSPKLEEGTTKDVDKRRLEQLRLELINLQTKFSETYPDVVKTKEEIGELEKKLAANEGEAKVKGDYPDNPAYITIASHLSSTRSEASSIERQINDSRKKVEEFQKRVAATPKIEKEYKMLLGERESTQIKYQDLMRKHMEAKVAEGLEKGQKGERFTLIDPASLPEKPDKPNRWAIILIGLVLGLGSGVGLMSFREFTDESIRQPDQLAMVSSVSLLASIPEIVTERDMAKQRQHRMLTVIISILVVCGAIAIFHFFIMDLNVFMAKLSRRLSTM